MWPVLNTSKLKLHVTLCMVFCALFFMSGCEELNTTVDAILGLGATTAQADGSQAPLKSFMLAAKKPSPRSAKIVSKSHRGKISESDVVKDVPKGKRRPPAVRAPIEKSGRKRLQTEKLELEFERDPFHPPIDRILPSECPPSMPLCRFDRSQLKLVGVIKAAGGQFKGMVEDPDGRGYFVTAGTQIGGATVTQVNERGVTLHDHLSGEDIMLPLVKEAKEASAIR